MTTEQWNPFMADDLAEDQALRNIAEFEAISKDALGRRLSFLSIRRCKILLCATRWHEVKG